MGKTTRDALLVADDDDEAATASGSDSDAATSSGPPQRGADFIDSLRLSLRNEVLAPPVVTMKSFQTILHDAKSSKKQSLDTNRNHHNEEDEEDDEFKTNTETTHYDTKTNTNDLNADADATEAVIRFLIQTAHSTLASLSTEKDRYIFKHQLRTSFNAEFVAT